MYSTWEINLDIRKVKDKQKFPLLITNKLIEVNKNKLFVHDDISIERVK